MEYLTTALEGMWGTLLAMSPYLLFGFLVAGALSVFVSPGHLADVDSAVDLVLRTTGRFRLPEPIRLAHRATTVCHLGNIAYRVGETLEFNGEFEKFIDNQEANMLLTRKYRHPYVIPQTV